MSGRTLGMLSTTGLLILSMYSAADKLAQGEWHWSLLLVACAFYWYRQILYVRKR